MGFPISSETAQVRWLENLERRVEEANAARTREDSNERTVRKNAEALGVSNGSFQFGPAANKPTSTYLLERGIGALLYLDTDNDILYGWNGLSWKSTTLT